MKRGTALEDEDFHWGCVERLSSSTLQGFPKAQIAVEYILINRAGGTDNNI